MEKGGFAVLINESSDAVHTMSAHQPDSICCMDGRIAPHQSVISVAGSGILIRDDVAAREHLVGFLREKKIKKVVLHEDCGAVGLYAKTKGISRERADEEALEWANELTALLGGVEPPSVLPVDTDFHNETCVYLELTDRFSLKGVVGFPPGFRVTVPAVSMTNALAQVEVALNIAFAEYGFDNLFTRDTPFAVAIVAENQDDLRDMWKNADLTRLVERHGGRAVIDGFVLPTPAAI